MLFYQQNNMDKIKLYFSLTKPRVIELLLITSVPTLFYFSNEIPSINIIFGVLVGGFLGAGGANALNAAIEAETDKFMARTKNRPTATGQISQKNGAIFSFSLLVLSFIIMTLTVNVLSAALILFAAFFYVVIYTIWLKPRTAQNIVIGGAAGAVPVLVAAAAINNSLNLESWILFLIIFLWTPPHFWALACHYIKDYRNAKFPMLPVTKGFDSSIFQSCLYAVLTSIACYAFVLVADINLVTTYLLSFITTGFLISSLFYYLKKLKHMSYFHITNIFLTCFFLSLMISA